MSVRILGVGQRVTPAEPDNIISLQRQPVLTNLVLTTGIEPGAKTYGPGNSPTPGGALFPDFTVDAYAFSYAVSDGAEMIPTDSVRGLRADMRFVNQGQTERTDKLLRYTLGGLVDDDEQRNAANPWNPAVKAANLARSQLTLDLELKKATLATTDANFGLVITVGSGSGWQQSGGNKMLADMTQAALYLENLIGVERDQFVLALFGNARRAAEESVELVARTVLSMGRALPSLADVQTYLKLGSVWGSNMLYKADINAAPAKIWGDDAILYYPGDRSRLLSGLGGRVWGFNFTLGPGAALTPYYVPRNTSWAYPWQKREATRILDTAVAVRIKNPYGT